MNSNYKVTKFRSNNSKEVNDQISIEEPLQIILKYKDKENWIENTISITMRTPGDDENLVTGFLFNERVIEKINHIENIQASGEPVGQYKLRNKIIVTINNSENIDIDKIKRNFLTNSSCGVCGKTSLESLEIIKKDKINTSVENFIDNLELFGIGASWGGYESLIMPIQPSRSKTNKWGKYENSMIRMYIGLEDTSDLIKDIELSLNLLSV